METIPFFIGFLILITYLSHSLNDYLLKINHITMMFKLGKVKCKNIIPFMYLWLYTLAQIGVLVVTCLAGSLFCVEASQKGVKDVMEAALAILLIAELDNAFGGFYWKFRIAKDVVGRKL